MTNEEQNEKQEILNAIDAANLRTEEFHEWVIKMAYPSEGIEKGWWYYATRHGHLAFTYKLLSGDLRITFCTYVPRSTNKGISIVLAGKSLSGKSLSEADIKIIKYEYSFEAIPERVLITCAFEAGWDPNEVTASTRFVEDFLDGYDDEFEKDFLLDQIFRELGVWFNFEEPDLYEQLGKFQTVQDVITYVQKHYKKG